MAGQCSFDNIITMHEVAHSIEDDTASPPRMIIKFYIAKAYETLDCSAIFAILTKMNFHPTWISWISSCLYNSSFSLLINGNPTA